MGIRGPIISIESKVGYINNPYVAVLPVSQRIQLPNG